MHSRQGGFTLIELVMVIVILGILAATAIPRFVDIEGAAEQAAVDGVAGALGSASAINYAVRSLSTANGTAIADCQDVEDALDGALSADYTITGDAIGNGSTTSCVVTGGGGTTANFVGHGVN